MGSKFAIETFDLTKVFKYEPFGAGQMWSAMWVDGIKKLFRSKKREKLKQFIAAVDHLNFKVEKGEFVGILGPNGAGKTTLVKLLCCVLRADEGTALVNGYDIDKEKYRVKASVSLVTQAGWRFFSYAQSVKENLELTAVLYGLPKKRSRKKSHSGLENSRPLG